MAGIKLDELFKSKLDQLNFEYKPEYWNEMEQKLQLNSGTSTTNGGFMGLGSIGQIAVVATFIGITGLVTYLSVPTKDGCDDEGVKQQYYKKNYRVSNNYILPQYETKTVELKDVTVVPKKAISSIETQYEVSTPAIDTKVINISLRETLKKENEEYISVQAVVDNHEVIKVEETIQPNITTVNRKEGPKEIIPIEKPIKRIFKPKDGILYRLGIRK